MKIMAFKRYHLNHCSIVLSHIRQVRRMLRENRYTDDCRKIIKEAQLGLARYRYSRTLFNSGHNGEYEL